MKACVATYKAKLRPLVRGADLFHVFPRPDGRNWDGIEYYDAVAGKGRSTSSSHPRGPPQETVRLKGLDAGRGSA